MKLFRKAVLTAAAVLSVLSANAEGYQINSQSAGKNLKKENQGKLVTMLNVEQLTRETTTGYIKFTGLVIPQTWNCQLLPTLVKKM